MECEVWHFPPRFDVSTFLGKRKDRRKQHGIAKKNPLLFIKEPDSVHFPILRYILRGHD